MSVSSPRALAVAALSAAALGACNVAAGPRGVEATGPFLARGPASERREVAPFASVHVAGSIRVEIRVGAPCALEFGGDEGRLDELSAEVIDGTLLLADVVGAPWVHAPRAVVTLPTLGTVTSTGSGWIAVSGLDADCVAVRLRGSGDVLLRGHAEELDAEDTGSGRVVTDDLVVGPAPTR